jgi:hypothetical protein
MNDSTVAVRRQGEGDLGVLSINDFAIKVMDEVNSKIAKN